MLVLMATDLLKRILPLSLLLFLTLLLYLPGLQGTLYYDDVRPLQQLSQIHNWESAALYITSEISGPLGRPVSMLTFAIQKNAWPDSLQHFLLFNILLHLCNGALVFFFCRLCLQVMHQDGQQSTVPQQTFALFFITSIWLLSPMQISTSLITVQRMTGLSAFFVLAGLLLYVHGLLYAANQRNLGRLLQITGLGLCTLVAAFSKENGILLPVLALVLEKTILRPICQPDQRFRQTLLWIYLAAIMSYLGIVIITSNGIYPFRDFNMLERVLTQPFLLLTYLKLSFFPDLFAYTPFHDQIRPFRSDELPWYAVAAILLMLSLFTLAIRSRSRFPVLSFAILWFLAAHLLESTVIGLELYFEHRNYIALLGPCFALGWYLMQCGRVYPRLIITGALSYLGLIALITGFVCTLWGTPMKAAEAWFDKQTGSARAAEHLATIYLREGYTPQAYFTLQAQVKACDRCIGSQAQYMLIACLMDDQTTTRQALQQVTALAASEKMLGGAPTTLGSLKKFVETKECKHITMQELTSLNLLLLQQQSKEINSFKRLELLLNLHQLAEFSQQPEQSQQFLLEAYSLLPNVNIGEVVFNNLLNSGKHAAAAEFMQQKVCNKPPNNIFARSTWAERCELMRIQLKTFELGRLG